MSDWKPVMNRKGVKTNPGVYWKPLSTKKNGVVKQDILYSIYYKFEGRPKRETVGRQSGGTTADECSGLLARLKKNRREKKGAFTLEQERAGNDRERKSEEAQREQQDKENTTVSTFWEEVFWPSRAELKKRTIDSNKAQFKKWIEPEIGSLPMKSISEISLNRICSKMKKAGQKPKSQKHAMGLISSMWTLARKRGYVTGDTPTREIKITVENQKDRFLTKEEARRLLDELAKVSKDTHDLALMSLNTGARFGELAKLTWQDVNFDSNLARFKDTKNGDSREVPLTRDVVEMLKGRGQGAPSELVFPSRNGKVRDRISKAFDRAIVRLGFNDDIADTRNKITFHGLRHTCASWLVEGGVPLFKVSKLLGHKDSRTTERYAHVKDFEDVVDTLESIAGWQDTATNKARHRALEALRAAGIPAPTEEMIQQIAHTLEGIKTEEGPTMEAVVLIGG